MMFVNRASEDFHEFSFHCDGSLNVSVESLFIKFAKLLDD